MCFFKVKHYFGHTSGMVGLIDVKRKGNALVGYWVQYVTDTPVWGNFMFSVRFRRSASAAAIFLPTSKPFELNLWYLAQRIYGSGEMYWMTSPWPWPKVTAVASISTNLLVCAIKWEPLIRLLQLYCTSHGHYLIRFGENSVENCYFGKFSLKFSDVFFQGQTLFGHL